MIFDTHVHLWNHPAPGAIDEDDFALLINRIDICGVDRVLLLGAVGSEGPFPSRESIPGLNDQTIEAVKRRPDRISGLCYLNPTHDPSFNRDELDRCLDAGLVGVKLWIALNARDPRHDPIMEHCAEVACPLLYHAWNKTVNKGEQESDSSDIAHLARRHPNVGIIMAHMMGCGVRGMSDVTDCPNVHVDVSGAQPFAGIFEYALETLGAGRILFGSDWPIRDFATQLGKVESQDITDEQREAMVWKNLHRLLGSRSPC